MKPSAMTVGELLERLASVDTTTPVWVSVHTDDGYIEGPSFTAVKTDVGITIKGDES